MANSIVGTWVINETLQSFTSVSSGTTSFSVTGVYNSLNGDGSLVELPFNTVALYRYNTTTTFKIYCDESVSDYTFNSYYSQNNKVSLTGDIRVSYTSEYSLRYFGSSNENFGLLRTFTITGGDDVTNEKLIAWLEANATLVEEEAAPTEITYNGTTTSIEAGQTATLACNGKKMKSDIVIAFGAAGTITYNGTETAVEAGKTATLVCAGKRMLTDVVVTSTDTVGSVRLRTSDGYVLTDTNGLLITAKENE